LKEGAALIAPQASVQDSERAAPVAADEHAQQSKKLTPAARY
jgi:hypothetical protein